MPASSSTSVTRLIRSSSVRPWFRAPRTWRDTLADGTLRSRFASAIWASCRGTAPLEHEGVRVAERKRQVWLEGVGIGQFLPRRVDAVAGNLPGVERLVVHLLWEPAIARAFCGSATRREISVSDETTGMPVLGVPDRPVFGGRNVPEPRLRAVTDLDAEHIAVAVDDRVHEAAARSIREAEDVRLK